MMYAPVSPAHLRQGLWNAFVYSRAPRPKIGQFLLQDRPNHHPQQQQQRRPYQRLLHHFSIASCGSRWYHRAKHLACLTIFKAFCTQRLCSITLHSKQWCLPPGSQEFLQPAARPQFTMAQHLFRSYHSHFYRNVVGADTTDTEVCTRVCARL